MSLKLLVLSQDSVQLRLELVNLAHVLVLDPKVVHLDLDVSHLRPQLVLLLLVADDSVKHALKALDLVVDLLDELVLRLLEHSLLDFDIDSLNLLDQVNGALSDCLDFFEDALYLPILTLQVLNQHIDSLQVLVSIDIFRHGSQLLLHILENLLLMSRLLDDALVLLLQVLDLVLLVLVLDTLVRDLLLLLKDLVVDWLFVLFPLLLKLLKFFVEFTNFILQHSQVLAS